MTSKPFKVVVIGDIDVGKSSLIHRITEGEFCRNAPTVGCNFRKHVAKSTFDEDVNMEIWDTAGGERYQSIVGLYYRQASAVIMMYDVTNPKTFLNVKQYWIEQIRTYCGDDVVIFLVGNKTDLLRSMNYQDQMLMVETEIQKWARENGIMSVECSVKSEDGIDKMVRLLADRLLERQSPVETGIRLEEYSYSSYCSC